MASRDSLNAAGDWNDRLAPSLDDIEAIGREAFAALPATFLARIGEQPGLRQPGPQELAPPPERPVQQPGVR